MSGTSAAILLHTCLFPFSGADFVLSVPFLQWPLPPPLGGPGSPPVGRLCSPFGRAPSPPLRRPSLIQESFQGPPPTAGGAVAPAGRWALSPPLRRHFSLLLLLLPPLQSGVGAAGAFPPLLGRPPLGAVGHHPLGWCFSASVRRPVLGSASPAVGFSRSSVPGVMLTGLSAILPAAFGLFRVCPLFPVWWWFVKVGWVTGLQRRELSAVGWPRPHFRNTLCAGAGAVAVAAGVCKERNESNGLVRRALGPGPTPTLEISLVTTSTQLLKPSESKPTESWISITATS